MTHVRASSMLNIRTTAMPRIAQAAVLRIPAMPRVSTRMPAPPHRTGSRSVAVVRRLARRGRLGVVEKVGRQLALRRRGAEGNGAG